MATKKKEAETQEARATQESVYSAKELADGHKAFNTSRAIVVTALRIAGKKEATFEEARAIIEEFKNKEVK